MVALTTGCSNTYLKEPLGREVSKEADLSSLDGQWVLLGSEKEEKPVVVIDIQSDPSDAARFEIRMVGEGNEQATYKVQVREAESEPQSYYVNAELGEKAIGDHQYSFGRFAYDMDFIVYWPANDDAFLEAINSGKLQGSLTKDKLILMDASNDELMKLLADDGDLPYFKWKTPLIWIRK